MTNISDTGSASTHERAVRASLRFAIGERITSCGKTIVAVEKDEVMMTHALYSALTLILKSIEAESGIGYDDLERALSLRKRASVFSPRSVKNRDKNKKLPISEGAWSDDEESSDLVRSADTSYRNAKEPRTFPEVIDRAKYRDTGRVDWSEPAPLGLNEQSRLLQLQKSFGIVRGGGGDEWLLKKDANVPELLALALNGRSNNPETLMRLLYHLGESCINGGAVLTNNPLTIAVISTLKKSGALPADHPLWLPIWGSSIFKNALAAQEKK